MYVHIPRGDQQCSYSFQAEGSSTPISFFYYTSGKPYTGKYIPFKDRVSWAGDLNKKDASISIANMQFLGNGTYFCDVKNPPDIVVKAGEIRLRVVEKDSLTVFPMMMVAGVAVAAVVGVVLLISLIACIVVRKKNSKKTLFWGPVIYAQLDHSGGQHSDKINKSESMVYADIQKN